ncbi:hypothetical protein PEL8287_00642 [Roseovarius litorisediminis]|uniref:Uncharacterized protein n=1 Tax=Roseovarius litorisediminis TaxID=1312363 RepID=A0A1Y5RFU7_9RHOB|nr:hypothetical protein PEL8287_00642 [Roseovarius litorisediminis]
MSDYRKPRQNLSCEQQPVHTNGLFFLFRCIVREGRFFHFGSVCDVKVKVI